jgi:hypothetical protein
MKKLMLTAGVGAMAFLLSSCFVLQSIGLTVGAVSPGGSTKLVLTVRPSSATKDPTYSKMYQFVLVGVDTPADVSIQGSKWGTNGKFGGPLNMPVSSSLATSIGTDCDASGFTYSTLTGITWKGFITPNPINDRQLVGQTAVIQVGLKAKAGATHKDNVSVIGLTGAWLDDGDGILNSVDSFLCTGNGSTFMYIK